MQTFSVCLLLLLWAESDCQHWSKASGYAWATPTPGYDWVTPNPQQHWMRPTPRQQWMRGRTSRPWRHWMQPTPGYDWVTPNPRWPRMRPTSSYWRRMRPNPWWPRMRPTSGYDWATQNPRWPRMRPTSGYDWATQNPRWPRMRPTSSYWRRMRPTSGYDWATQNPWWPRMRPTSGYDWATQNPWWPRMRPNLPNPLIRVYRLVSNYEDAVIVSCQCHVPVHGSQLQLKVVVEDQSFTMNYPDFSRGTEHLFKITVSSPASFSCVQKLDGKTLLSDVFIFSKHIESHGFPGPEVSLSYQAFAGTLGFLLILMISGMVVMMMMTLLKIQKVKQRTFKRFPVSEDTKTV